MFEATPDYKKLVLSMFLVKVDVDILYGSGYSKVDNNRPCIESKN